MINKTVFEPTKQNFFTIPFPMLFFSNSYQLQINMHKSYTRKKRKHFGIGKYKTLVISCSNTCATEERCPRMRNSKQHLAHNHKCVKQRNNRVKLLPQKPSDRQERLVNVTQFYHSYHILHLSIHIRIKPSVV